MAFAGLRALATGLALASWLAATHAALAQSGGTEVDVELVLAVDISGSMDYSEQVAQRDGYVQAFRSPDVQKAITSGLIGRIAVTFMGWAGAEIQQVFVPWTLIDSKASADAFAERISKMPLGTYRGTSISSALMMSASLFEKSGFAGTRKTIDISGDGPNNMGGSVLEARAKVLAKGITINGLPLMLPGHDSSAMRNLDQYYKECVIGGPAAFLYTVTKLDEFPIAIRRKLIQEIADWPSWPQRSILPVQAPMAPPVCAERPMFYYGPFNQ